MKKWRLSFAFAVVLILPLGVTGQSDSDIFHIAWGSNLRQISADLLVPAHVADVSQYSWIVETGMDFAASSGPVSLVKFYGPPYPDGRPMDMNEGNPFEYKFEIGFFSESEMTGYIVPGTYGFTWAVQMGNSRNEPMELPAYDPLEPRKLLNYDALQDIDPMQPVLIEWEPLTGMGDKGGFIDVEVAFSDGGNRVVWSSNDYVTEGLGLDPSTTSVELPAGILQGSPTNQYEVNVYFARIEYLVELTTNPSGLKGVATTTKTQATIRTRESAPGKVVLTPGQWQRCDMAGWAYGITPDWGYSLCLGWVYLGYTPSYVYQSKLGWLSPMAGNVGNGLWFYSYTLGWIFTAEDYGGWYSDPVGNWANMLTP